MLNIHYDRAFPIANRRGTLIFVMPKVEVFAACYATTQLALCSALLSLKQKISNVRAEQGA